MIEHREVSPGVLAQVHPTIEGTEYARSRALSLRAERNARRASGNPLAALLIEAAELECELGQKRQSLEVAIAAQSTAVQRHAFIGFARSGLEDLAFQFRQFRGAGKEVGRSMIAETGQELDV
jgi:hypothetical protein